MVAKTGCVDSLLGYYNYFPAKSFNVSVQDKGSKKILVAEKDFEAGDVIYTVCHLSDHVTCEAD